MPSSDKSLKYESCEISEGIAEYGIQLVFPAKEKVEFEKEVLFPIAGFDPSNADLCNHVFHLITMLRSIRIEVARDYLDNKISKQEAIDRLMRFQFLSKTEAEWTLSSIEEFQSYSINYTVGLNLIGSFIESSVSNIKSQKEKWSVFQELLKTPNTPSTLFNKTSLTS